MVTIFGHDTEREWGPILSRIGYCMSEERSFFWRLTGKQNLEFFASLLEIPPDLARRRIAELMRFLDLEESADKRFLSYSSGMKQRMAVARSLLTDPDALFMDEPTRGLDPRGATRLHGFIKEHVGAAGKATIVTTNRVSDIEHLCQRIAVLNHGRIIAIGTIPEIRESMSAELGIAGDAPFGELFTALLEHDAKRNDRRTEEKLE
jgi:ABC-2 type transport system ATP-binding protein